MRKLSLFTIAGLALLALACSLSVARADYIYDVSIDTSGLSSDTNLTGPFGIDFELTSGGADSGNTATISNFNFGVGGSPRGSASSLGGTESGSLSSTVILTVNDTDTFFSDFNQGFTPGSTLSFQVDLTMNSVANSPDTLSIYLLQSYPSNNITPIPTSDPTGSDTLLTTGVTSSTPPTQTYGGTNPNDPITTNATPNASPVPEPGTLVLGLLALGSLVSARGWKRLRRTKADLGEQLV